MAMPRRISLVSLLVIYLMLATSALQNLSIKSKIKKHAVVAAMDAEGNVQQRYTNNSQTVNKQTMAFTATMDSAGNINNAAMPNAVKMTKRRAQQASSSLISTRGSSTGAILGDATTTTTTTPFRLCSHTCSSDGNGICDDGGDGAMKRHCPLGSDCTDCGVRFSNGDALTPILTYRQQATCEMLQQGRLQPLPSGEWCGSKNSDCVRHGGLSGTEWSVCSSCITPKWYKLGNGGGIHPCEQKGRFRVYQKGSYKCTAAPYFMCCANFCKNMFNKDNIVNLVEPNKWCREFDDDEQECPKKMWRNPDGMYYMCVWDTNVTRLGNRPGCRVSLLDGCACKDSS